MTGNDWWERDDLRYHENRLHFAGQDVEALAQALGTPLYLYNGARVGANLLRLRRVLQERSLKFRIFYAMKANRFAPLLASLKTLGQCGIDACSPQEILFARQCGFGEQEISFTGTSLSDEDLEWLVRQPRVAVNCDSLSAIRRLGERSPGREIGIRINLHLGIGYGSNPHYQYATAQTTKFGIYQDRFPEALALAQAHGLQVTGLHLHTGCGYLTPQLPVWERILATAGEFLDQAPGIRHVNVGGGLGVPLVAQDAPLDLDAWGDILARQLGRRGVEVWLEPGEYLVKDAGLLVLATNSVERREDTLFVGVNGGFNIHMEPVFYDLPVEVVPCRRRDAPAPALQPTTIAGNINEARDLFARDYLLPPLEEGEYLAFLNAGAYAAALSSNHCMRGQFSEYLLL